MIKTFKVEGMSCQHCIKAIIKQFEKTGIKNFTVQIGLVEVDMPDDETNSLLIKSLIENAGFRIVDE